MSLFLSGGVILYFVAEPFLESMPGLALILGVSQYVFVQWLAPFLSEFPEKVSAFYWARKVTKAPMALMNMISSTITVWTLLAALIPIVFSISRGGITPIVFDHQQEMEILLTMAQTILGFLLLANMSFSWYEAAILFGLWAIQFAWPHIRLEITVTYFVWIAVELILLAFKKRSVISFKIFGELIKEHFSKQRTQT